MQVEALTAVFNGALTNVQQRSGSGLWLRFHLATIKQKMAIKDHRKRNKIPSDMEVAPTHKLLSPVTPLTLLTLLKGILHQKIFYRLNLIFWIVMGCGIARFGRRGLKTTET